jgi:peptide/nickel transport system permease protein
VSITFAADAGGGGLLATSARSVGLTILRRLGSALIVLWGAITFTFISLHLIRGSIVDAIVGQASVTPAVRAQIIKDYALDKPLLVQYFQYLGRLLHGDLGHSYNQGIPVSQAIGSQIGSTFALIASSVLLALVGAIVVAVLTANRRRWIRAPFAGLEVLSVAVPAFWLGILLLTVFSFKLHWFPAVGANGFRGLVLPSISLALAPGAMLSQILRQGLERTLEEPFVTTARARGLGSAAVLVRHALRHAMMPVITLTGWLAGAFIGGAVVIESVFSRQGLGQLIASAIQARDFPVVSGVVLISAATYVVVNFTVDAIYPLLDPRLRAAPAAPRSRKADS